MVDKSYYSTKHWRTFSQSLLDDPTCICEICKRPRWKLRVKGKNKGKYRRLLKFSVHHKHYRTVGREIREDVLTLCSFCHTQAHAALRGKNASEFHAKLATMFEEAGFVYEKE